MPISTDIHIEALLARFRAQRGDAARPDSRRPAGTPSAGSPGASSITQGDRVEISFTANMTVEAVNGVLNDSVVEQINRAIQEAGIDLTVEEAAGRVDVSPEATAQRIADFATGYRPGYDAAHAGEGEGVRLSGFMSLIRGAIRDGFTHARDFLESITKLSDAIGANIDRTFELTNRYLDGLQESWNTESAGSTKSTGEARETAGTDGTAPAV